MRPDAATRIEAETSTLLVLAVARLGEIDQAGWWGSHGLSTTGRYVLSSTFPRTWAPVALELDITSATRRQDQLLDRVTALHLFSDQLPFRRIALAWLAERKTAEPSQMIARLQELDEAGVRDLIESEIVGASGDGESIGAGLLLGRLSEAELEDQDTLISTAKALAAAYVDQGPELKPPYFDLSP